MTTIREVAKKANVAISTVSYVLNNTNRVKQETRDRIMSIIKELDYQPNQVARSLKTKKTCTIGIVVPDISHSFFIDIIGAIDATADKYNYNIILCNTNEDQKKEYRYLNNLVSKGIDGLIFIATCKNPSILNEIKNIPIVIVDRKFGQNLFSVTVDNEKGGYYATSHLIAKKKSEIFLITGPLSINSHFDRMTGYIKALKENGLQYNEMMVRQCDVNIESGFKMVESLLEQKVKFDSIFITDDLIALGAVKALIKGGIRIPEEVSIVGYDDIPTAAIFTPSLTTVEQPKYMIGEKAAKLLFEQINNRPIKCKNIVLEPRLIVRETT